MHASEITMLLYYLYFSINNWDIPQCEDTDHAVIFRAGPWAVA